MGMSIYFTVALASLARLTVAATPAEWASRSIYQVITDRFARTNGSTAPCDINKYCGGSWAGLTKNLDYIQNMGFTAIQISPITENLPQDTIYGEAFHGYWPQDIYSLNSNFGTADDLKNLSTELHNRGMYLLVDIVVADMAYDIGNTTMTTDPPIKYSVFNPFNDPKYYHPYCNITDWTNVTNYQECWLGVEGVATPDLATENPAVLAMMQDWIKGFVANYSIDGLRLDGAKQVDYAFFQPFISTAGVYTMAEVYDGDQNFVCFYQNLTHGLENYPVLSPAIEAFTAGNMLGLASMVKKVASACAEPQYLATFVENQDIERFASYTPDMALAMNALAFIILADGIPKVYYGQEQHVSGNYSPYNRGPLWTTKHDTNAPLYNLTATLNTIRNHAISIDSRYVSNHSIELYTDNSTYATRKGPDGVQIVSVFSNQGEHGGTYELAVPGAAAAGTHFTDVIDCTTVIANSVGNITVQMGAGLPKVFFPSFNLNGSGLCGTKKATPSGNPGSTNTSSGGAPSKKGAGAQLQLHFATLATCSVFAFVFWLL